MVAGCVVDSYAVARKMALSFPEATEEPHFDLGSFRVRGKIFVTVPDKQHFRVFVDEHESRAAAGEDPDAFELLVVGKEAQRPVGHARGRRPRPLGRAARRRLATQGPEAPRRRLRQPRRQTIAGYTSALSWLRKSKVPDGVSWTMKITNRSWIGSTQKIVLAAPPQ